MGKKPTVERFWMVWSPRGHAPTRRHPIRHSANTEAARLARVMPAQSFFVLKVVGGVTAAAPELSVIKVTARHRPPEKAAPSDDTMPF